MWTDLNKRIRRIQFAGVNNVSGLGHGFGASVQQVPEKWEDSLNERMQKTAKLVKISKKILAFEDQNGKMPGSSPWHMQLPGVFPKSVPSRKMPKASWPLLRPLGTAFQMVKPAAPWPRTLCGQRDSHSVLHIPSKGKHELQTSYFLKQVLPGSSALEFTEVPETNRPSILSGSSKSKLHSTTGTLTALMWILLGLLWDQIKVFALQNWWKWNCLKERHCLGLPPVKCGSRYLCSTPGLCWGCCAVISCHRVQDQFPVASCCFCSLNLWRLCSTLCIPSLYLLCTFEQSL